MELLNQKVENNGQNRKEMAAESYFRLYLKDWAEHHNLNTHLQKELLEMLKDFSSFVEVNGNSEVPDLEQDEEYLRSEWYSQLLEIA